VGGIKLGAEEDGFALEHFDGEEKSGGGVGASGTEDQSDYVPMVGAGDEIFAKKADVENGDESEFGREFDAREHGGDRRDDDHEHERRDVALRFLVTVSYTHLTLPTICSV